jgi:hypothetical protein
MDDFLYAEPVPEPSSIALAAVAMCGLLRRPAESAR